MSSPVFISSNRNNSINSYVNGEQKYPHITKLKDGSLFGVWFSEGQDGSGVGIYGRKANANGDLIGSEIKINTYTENNQWTPHAIVLENGNIVVSWHSQAQETDGSTGVYAQILSPDLQPVGSEFLVNSYQPSYQAYTDVAALSNGGFVIVWHSDGQDGSGTGIYGQRFDSSGNKADGEFQINSNTANKQLYPSVTSLPNGGFAVVWETRLSEANADEVAAQFFDSTGAKVGAEIQVNSISANNQDKAELATLTNGNVVVVWRSYSQDGDGYGVYGQILTAEGVKVGTEFQVNTYTNSHQTYPSVTGLSDGGFAVVWKSKYQDGDGYGIYGQTFSSDGSKTGEEFRVNSYSSGDQGRPVVEEMANKSLAVVWQSDGQDGSSWGIYSAKVSKLNEDADALSRDNIINSTSANDVIDGGGGLDTLIASGNRSTFSVSKQPDGSIQITGSKIGTDTLSNIEKIQFSDSAYNLEVSTKAASISKTDLNSLIDLYVAYFNRVPEASGLSYWIDQFKGGKTADQIAKEFYDAGVQFSEVTGYTADMSNGDFIRKAYANVLGRSGDKAPPQADVDYWDNQITSGAVTKEGMIKSMLAGARTFANDPEWGWVTKLLDNKVELGRLHAVTYGLDYNDTKTSIDKTVEYASKVTADGIDTAVNLIGLTQDDYIA